MTDEQPPRRIDRRRREKIIDGALKVIASRGIEGLTHRSVAEAAEVPPSAPSYYFASIEDLLEAAMHEAAARDVTALKHRLAGDPTAEELPRLLAEHIVGEFQPDHVPAIVTVELYIAALRREGLHEIAVTWNEQWLDLLSPMVGRRGAYAAMAMTSGVAHRAMLSESPPTSDEIADLLRATIEQATKTA